MSMSKRRGHRLVWLLVNRRQRSGGRHLVGPVWADTEWHSHQGVRYLHLALGNPKRHARWAFTAYLYLSHGRRWSRRHGHG